jgi:hypothetical protein
MKRNYVLLIILLISTIGQAQSVTLNPELDIDTLAIWMDYSDEIESELQSRLQESVINAIDKFNAEQSGFIVVLDSMQTTTSMRMNMGAINYVDKKDNLIWTGVGLVTLAGHAYAISTVGFTLPILLLRSTVSVVQIETSLGLVTNKPKLSRFFINPFGMYMKIEKQKDKMVLKTEKATFKFLKNLSKQDERNNRP